MTAAQILAGQIDAVGGLVSQYEMAREWNWSRSHVHMLLLRGVCDAPAPVTHVTGRPLYARDEMLAWKTRYDETQHHRRAS